MTGHCPPDTGFEIQDLAVWGRARYLSFSEAPHNTESLRVSGGETFVSLKPECESGGRNRDLRLSKQADLPTASMSANTIHWPNAGQALNRLRWSTGENVVLVQCWAGVHVQFVLNLNNNGMTDRDYLSFSHDWQVPFSNSWLPWLQVDRR